MSMSGWKNSGISGRALLTKYQVRRIGLHAAELPDDVVHPQDVSLNQESGGSWRCRTLPACPWPPIRFNNNEPKVGT
jgi:hypothetical protein